MLLVPEPVRLFLLRLRPPPPLDSHCFRHEANTYFGLNIESVPMALCEEADLR